MIEIPKKYLGKIFLVGENRMNSWEILPMSQNIWPKGPEDIYF